jgi:hypothetical protein
VEAGLVIGVSVVAIVGVQEHVVAAVVEGAVGLHASGMRAPLRCGELGHSEIHNLLDAIGELLVRIPDRLGGSTERVWIGELTTGLGDWD